MKYDCQCDRPDRLGCAEHPACACGHLRSAHRNKIGECDAAACHGCPEYRPAEVRPFSSLGDAQLDELPAEQLRAHYRALRAHHIEETTALSRNRVRVPGRVARTVTASEREREAALELLLQARDINQEDCCGFCGGYGNRLYSHGSTWRGGVGTNSFQVDICDQCWGSGDRTRPWMNLRTARDEMASKAAEAAVDLLARSCGANFHSESTKTQVRIIIEHIDAIQRKRKIGNAEMRDLFWVRPLANGLANTLRRALGDDEKELP